ncbi:hypothetical protein RRG08_051351 [Elysia crispata]|uniref:Uncharacterized protein n=1 Tax=Elysia crispata TaxID=231223 RepID=A0AAE1B3Y1_9GAST|nr:hypothetical protein RRG08_051351 [Elysia crispata]
METVASLCKIGETKAGRLEGLWCTQRGPLLEDTVECESHWMCEGLYIFDSPSTILGSPWHYAVSSMTELFTDSHPSDGNERIQLIGPACEVGSWSGHREKLSATVWMMSVSKRQTKEEAVKKG